MINCLCFGSLNLDYTYTVDHFVNPGETEGTIKLETFCGGKGLNQAAALARAGAEAYMAGCIGSEGEMLKNMLKIIGCDVSLVKSLPQAKTGHAIIQVTPDGENAILTYGGANHQIDETFIDHVLEHFQAGDYLILQNEINKVDALILKAAARGMKIFFTPAPVKESTADYPINDISYLFVNRQEARTLSGCTSDDPKEILEALHVKWPNPAVVLTDGSKGAWYSDAQTTFFQRAYKVTAVDTTGAGDTFAGYFAASLSLGKDIQTSMNLAARAAAIQVTRPGACAAIPALEEAENYRF